MRAVSQEGAGEPAAASFSSFPTSGCTRSDSTFPKPSCPQPQPAPPRELGFISPVVAKIAAEQNVELSKVPGTGMGGRITKKDIEKLP